VDEDVWMFLIVISLDCTVSFRENLLRSIFGGKEMLKANRKNEKLLQEAIAFIQLL